MNHHIRAVLPQVKLYSGALLQYLHSKNVKQVGVESVELLQKAYICLYKSPGLLGYFEN